jgi:hypothetical protein
MESTALADRMQTFRSGSIPIFANDARALFQISRVMADLQAQLGCVDYQLAWLA